MKPRIALSAAMRFLFIVTVLLGLLSMTGSANKSHAIRDKASFLDQATSQFIRPGLKVKIESAQIASDGTIQARFKLTDATNGPLDMAGVYSPGTINVRLIAAYIPAGKSQYVSYSTTVAKAALNTNTAVQASYDSGGKFTKVADGEYDYTFKTKAPAGFDVTATHTVGMQAERDLSAYGLGTAGIDDVYTFVPSGSAPKTVRNVIDTSTCNGCHDPMSAHGGSRQKVEMCVLCHTPQTSNPDTGLTMDFPVLVHKIHMGKNLPSVKAGGKYRIYHRGAWSDFSDVGFPNDIQNCNVCHKDGTKQANAYLTPSRQVCGSCHDNVNFATGENHVDLPQVSDNQCSTCHQPQDGQEFGASIQGAHVVPRFSKQVTGVNFSLLKVDNGSAGKSPTVTFSIKDNSGKPIPATSMNRVALVIAGPTTDYANSVSEDATKTTCGTDGTCVYTFKWAIPSSATGTYTVGIEGRQVYTLNPGTKKQQTVQVGGDNKTLDFSVDGTPVQARRTVVSLDGCNSCHGSLTVHGANRNQIEMCVLCHNPNGTDAVQRSAAQMPAQAIDFRTMVHKIHTGKDLTSDYTIYGYGKTPVNFNDVGFPGDRRNCAKCHVDGSQELPLKDNLLTVVTPQGYTPTTAPTTAACVGCHTQKAVMSHAITQTSSIGESCATCHGPDTDYSLDRVHAR